MQRHFLLQYIFFEELNMKKFCVTIMLLIVMCLPLFACSNSVTHHTSVDEGDVALLTIFTFDGKGEGKYGLKNLGHSFLSVENISEDTIKVGKVEVPAGDSISIGTWSIKAHFGVWYNVESVYISTCNKYDGRISITAGINIQDLDTINDFILSHDYWTPTNNCSNFALNLWNSVAGDDEELIRPFIYSPSKIYKELVNFEGYEINKVINTSIDKMFYCDDNDTAKYYSLEV